MTPRILPQVHGRVNSLASRVVGFHNSTIIYPRAAVKVSQLPVISARRVTRSIVNLGQVFPYLPGIYVMLRGAERVAFSAAGHCRGGAHDSIVSARRYYSESFCLLSV